MAALAAWKAVVVPVMVVLAFMATLVNPYPVVLLTEQETDEGTELTGTVSDLDWTAVLREIKAIDGSRFRKVKISIKDGERVELVEVELDARLKPGPVKSILDYINRRR